MDRINLEVYDQVSLFIFDKNPMIYYVDLIAKFY